MSTDLDRATDLIRQADTIIVAAGAGMGVDSGLPDFRGTEGFWRAYPALAQAGIEFTSIASPRAFRAQPELAWGFYGHRLALYRATKPHAGFGLLKKWGATQVFTSNVDGHFESAGFSEVYECHGSIHHLQCLRSCADDIWSAESFAPEVDLATCRLLNAAPRCPQCGGLARPNILMFGDSDWVETRSQEQSARLEQRLRDIGNAVVVELGAGTAVPSVRYFSERLSRSGKARLIRINPREPQAPPSSVSLAMGALEALTAIDSRL